jgi:hypothetical protein
MIIDTTEQEVSFQHETLCVYELQALVDLLNNGPAGDPPLASVEYPLVAYIRSESHEGLFYQIKKSSVASLWTCTCLDFEHRGYTDLGEPNGHACKHIRRHILYSMN